MKKKVSGGVFASKTQATVRNTVATLTQQPGLLSHLREGEMKPSRGRFSQVQCPNLLDQEVLESGDPDQLNHTHHLLIIVASLLLLTQSFFLLLQFIFHISFFLLFSFLHDLKGPHATPLNACTPKQTVALHFLSGLQRSEHRTFTEKARI